MSTKRVHYRHNPRIATISPTYAEIEYRHPGIPRHDAPSAADQTPPAPNGRRLP